MLDLIVRNCTLPDGRQNMDIGVQNGRIAAVETALVAEAAEVVDAEGMLVSSPFVDAHFHMDSTLSYGLPRVNESGTLLEGIALWGELKPLLTQDAIVERALAYCDWAAARGLLAIRSPGDVCDPRLLAPDALLLVRALDMGVDVVGGIPHFERTMADGAESVRWLCELAAERGLRVDMHCDESDDPMSRHIESLAYETQRIGLHGRVNGSHLTSMHSMDNYYVSKLLPLMREAGVSAIANPLINITLQGRQDTYPKRRGMTRVPEMLAAGIPVAFGQDCCMDPWYSLGSGDMLEVAHMGMHVGQMTSQNAMRQCFEAVTSTPASILGLEGYGLEVGCNADMVLLQARSASEAIRLRATRLKVWRRGALIASSPASTASLNLPGRPASVSFLAAR